MDPTVIAAALGAWASIMTVAIKGAMDARAAKAQTNGALHEPLARIEGRLVRVEERLVRVEERQLDVGVERKADRVAEQEHRDR